jgi:hypothetical protein
VTAAFVFAAQMLNLVIADEARRVRTGFATSARSPRSAAW